MYCPRCGEENPGAATACQACTFDLTVVRGLLDAEAVAAPAFDRERRYLRSLVRGSRWTVVVVLGVLWALRFLVGEITAENFTPALIALTWIAIFILLLNVGLARRERAAAS